MHWLDVDMGLLFSLFLPFLPSFQSSFLAFLHFPFPLFIPSFLPSYLDSILVSTAWLDHPYLPVFQGTHPTQLNSTQSTQLTQLNVIYSGRDKGAAGLLAKSAAGQVRTLTRSECVTSHYVLWCYTAFCITLHCIALWYTLLNRTAWRGTKLCRAEHACVLWGKDFRYPAAQSSYLSLVVTSTNFLSLHHIIPPHISLLFSPPILHFLLRFFPLSSFLLFPPLLCPLSAEHMSSYFKARQDRQWPHREMVAAREQSRAIHGLQGETRFFLLLFSKSFGCRCCIIKYCTSDWHIPCFCCVVTNTLSCVLLSTISLPLHYLDYQHTTPHFLIHHHPAHFS